MNNHSSDMIIHIHSDASYLSEDEAKSEQGGSFTWETPQNITKNSQTGQF
jgi:hypothetical protein